MFVLYFRSFLASPQSPPTQTNKTNFHNESIKNTISFHSCELESKSSFD